MLYTIKTSGGWTYSGVEPWELEGLLRKIKARGDSVTVMQKIRTPPARYDLNTVYFPNRSELKWKIANTDPQLQAQLRQRAMELYRKYLQIAKSYDQDIQKYPRAARGLRRSQQMYYQRAQELRQFAQGNGQVPKWFARLYVNTVTGTQLHEIGYNPTHIRRRRQNSPMSEGPRTITWAGQKWVRRGNVYVRANTMQGVSRRPRVSPRSRRPLRYNYL